MKKLFYVMFVVMVMGFMVNPAMALLDNHNTTNNYDYSDNSVTNNQGGTGVGIGVGISKSEANNHNTNVNKVDNRDVNINKVDNRDVNVNIVKPEQGQVQRQGQGQAQGQSMIFKQTFEDKRDHIQGPNLINSNTSLAKTHLFAAKASSSIWNKVNGLTFKQAKKLFYDSKDSNINIKKNILFEKNYRTKYINKGVSGNFMGTLIVTPDGKGTNVSVGGMEAKAAMIAMELGATHMNRTFNGAGSIAGGNSWNIGIGGGASLMSDGDKVAIAPNGGFGVGGATAFNEALPEMVFDLYSDVNLVKKLNTGNIVNN